MSEAVEIIRQFREQHHAVARYIVMGYTDSMIRRQTGLSQRSLSLIRGAPCFDDLIASYAKVAKDKFQEHAEDFGDLMRANMLRGEVHVQEHFERAEDEGRLLPLNLANKISQDRADRLGYSKHQVVHHNHDFASQLDRAIERSGKKDEMKLIEGQVVAPALQGPGKEELTAREPTAPAQVIEGQVAQPQAPTPTPVLREPEVRVSSPRLPARTLDMSRVLRKLA